MTVLPRRLAALVVAALCAVVPTLAPAADAAPRVVASIPPVHALVARIMAGVGEPALLIPGQASPHSFALRPSDARRLAAADLIVWVGPSLETSLQGPLAALGGTAQRLALIDAPGIERLPVRAGGVWGDHEDADGHAAATPTHDHGGPGDRAKDDHAPAGDTQDGHTQDGHTQDGGEREHAHDGHDDAVDAHIWLSTGNARAIVAAVAAALIARDPAHAAAYAANRDAALAELAALADELHARLAPVHERPFVVLHDAYQYFERQFGLAGVGAIAVTPDIRAGARRLAELRAEVRARNARCIFAEPQAESGQVRTVAEGSGARVGTLDPIGAGLPPGPELYGRLMRGLAAGVADCLAAEG